MSRLNIAPLAALAFLLVVCLGMSPVRASEPPADPVAAVEAIIAAGDGIVASYDPARRMVSADRFSSLYFEQFEPLENPLGAVDPGLKESTEAKFSQTIGKLSKGAAPADVAAAWSALRGDLQQVGRRLAPQSGFWSTLVQSFLILLREGFEAMLVVTALLAYLRRAGQADKISVVYGGVGLAVVASLVTAWLISTVMPMSGQGREVMEGATMMVAAVVLFYCSYWLFAKREAARWQHYVQQQIDQALSGGKLYALGFAAFLAVFREGAETVLFYQALAGSAQGQMAALLLGLGLAVVALAALYVAMTVLSVRLPMKLFFGVTAGLLYYLALTFAGKGMVELQNGKAVSITPLTGWPSLDWLGVFPTAEGMMAQGMLVLPLLLALGWWLSRRQALRKESRA